MKTASRITTPASLCFDIPITLAMRSTTTQYGLIFKSLGSLTGVRAAPTALSPAFRGRPARRSRLW
ncbi:hypothetical protein CFP59_00734 [Streptomyces malaysiensis subsp. malaysiensis]|nr:hypothetical protein CFP59_00734 [Streptomyces sp. M56]